MLPFSTVRSTGNDVLFGETLTYRSFVVRKQNEYLNVKPVPTRLGRLERGEGYHIHRRRPPPTVPDPQGETSPLTELTKEGWTKRGAPPNPKEYGTDDPKSSLVGSSSLSSKPGPFVMSFVKVTLDSQFGSKSLFPVFFIVNINVVLCRHGAHYYPYARFFTYRGPLKQ